MTASLETVVIAAYVFATSLHIPRPGPEGKVTDPELVALAVAQAAIGLCSDRQRLGAVGRLLPGYFPELPDQSQYNRRLRRLTPWITTVQLMVAELIAEGQVRLVDGTLIACANYPGCQSHSEFAGHASTGYCPSKSEFVWGMRLVLISDRKGVPVGYDLVGPKTGQERVGALELGARPRRQRPVRRQGFWGREYASSMQLLDIELVTPECHRLGERPPAEARKAGIPAGHRVGLLQPQATAAPHRPRRQDPSRPRPTRRPTPPRTHTRHLPQRRDRAPTPSARRLRRTMNPHQAS
jgi:hypothetical protein